MHFRMDKSWMRLDRTDARYGQGIRRFLEFVAANCGELPVHYCPCKQCRCRGNRCPIATVERHLHRNGFWNKYTRWIYHGEASAADPHDHGQFADTASSSNYDPTRRFIDDMFPHESGVFHDSQAPVYVPPEVENFPHIEPLQPLPRVYVNTRGMDKYHNLIQMHQTPLYHGCPKTVLESVMAVMQLKVETKSTVAAVDRWP